MNRTRSMGSRPTLSDARDKRFTLHRLAGSVQTFEESYDADAGTTMPDQNADARPTGCTSYTLTDIGNDQDKVLYSTDFTFSRTLELMGVPPDNDGADPRIAFKTVVAFGLLPKKKEPKGIMSMTQSQAADTKNWPATFDTLAEKKPAYLPIFPSFQDWFDSIRSALAIGKAEHRSIGISTPWYGEFEEVGSDGLLTETPSDLISWHMYKISGWTKTNSKGKLIRNGESFLKAKTWQGKKYGDKGYVYISRFLAKKLLGSWGAYAATIQDLPTNTIEEIKARRVTLMEATLALLQNLYIQVRYGIHL